MPLVSIIIRAKDEEYWIGKVLRQVLYQKFTDYEMVLVDSGSADNTKAIFRSFVQDGTLVELDEPYAPGKAINLGIEASAGSLIALLSAHCVPADEDWLGSLVRKLEDPEVGAAYGRQLPLPASHPWDKRDLLNMFGVERRVQRRDTFFHNANSVIRRSVWQQVPFDPHTPHAEDRLWAEQILPHGWTIVYEPQAAVYHYHGMNHHQDMSRALAISDILTQSTMEAHQLAPLFMDAQQQDTLYCVLGHDANTHDRLPGLLDKVARCCPRGRVFVHSVLQDQVPPAQACAVSRKDSEDEQSFVDILHRLLNLSAEQGYYPCCVVYVNLRQKALQMESVGKLVTLFYEGTYDSVFFAREEYNNVWMRSEVTYRQVLADYSPRPRKDPIFISHYGLGLATKAEFVRSRQLVGAKVGIVSL